MGEVKKVRKTGVVSVCLLHNSFDLGNINKKYNRIIVKS